MNAGAVGTGFGTFSFMTRSLIGLLAAAIAAGGCAVNPVTGERQLALISEDQEIALGRDSAEQIAQQLALVGDDELQQYVANIGQSLAAASERPDLPWTFQVVDDPAPNAFALPGGFIFVTRGLLALMDSEAELAGVLGHEIGHVTARHSVVQLSRQQLAQLGLGLGMVLSPELAQFGDLAGAGLNLLFLSYGRNDERQADELGFGYMLGQGYDVMQMAEVFQALQRSGELAGASPLPTWLASHPSEPERIEAVRARVAALPQPQVEPEVGREEFLDRIDGLVYGADPRAGYFDGGTFYHPELAFELAVPAEWRRQNLSNMVVAASEANDAAMQLTLVPAGSAEEAARQFAAQQNLEVAASARDRLNGNPAVVSRFRAAAGDGGIVAGYAAHIEHGGRVFQVVAYAAEARFDGYARGLEQLVGSFAPLTDSNRLNVEARRIEIVPLERAMSFDEFTRRYPSSIDAEELAVLNQIEDASRELAAGTRMKRVVGGPA